MVLSIKLSNDSVTVSQHPQYQGPETKAAKWNSDVHFIIYTCASITERC